MLARTLRARNPKSIRVGVQLGSLKGTGSSRVLDDPLSCYLSLVFKHS